MKTPNARIARAMVVVVLALALHAQPLAKAQDTNGSSVPRTPTFPAVEGAAFPYVEPEEAGFPLGVFDHIGGVLQGWVAAGQLMGAEVMILKDRKIVFHEAVGWSDKEEGRPLERNSIYAIKSMSKPFTAASIMMLRDEGELSLDDPISSYIPTFADDGVTIRNLLSHSSGFAGLSWGVEGRFDSLAEWIETWGEMASPSAPVGAYNYADVNYGALGYIVEAVSGIPVDEFIERRILEPLKLHETYTHFSPDSTWADRLNDGYIWNERSSSFEKYWNNEQEMTWTFYPAAWGMYSTTSDYAKWLQAWIEGTVGLDRATIDEMMVPVAGDRGLGWNVFDDGGVFKGFMHGGIEGTQGAAVPGLNLTVLYFSHSRGHDMRDEFLELMISAFGVRRGASNSLARPIGLAPGRFLSEID